MRVPVLVRMSGPRGVYSKNNARLCDAICAPGYMNFFEIFKKPPARTPAYMRFFKIL